MTYRENPKCQTWVPNGYRVTDEFFIIERPGKNIRIRISDITKIEYHRRWVYSRMYVTWGGPFGYAGINYRVGYGYVRLYSKRLSKMVVISTKYRNILIGPEHPEEFRDEVKKLMAKCEKLNPVEIEPTELSNQMDDKEETKFAEVIDC